MASLEDIVRAVVQDFVKSNTLFTALDVSNLIKQSQPHVRHREVRDEVRKLYATDIEVHGWARTPITVTLPDASTAEALLYHDLADSWDLDHKYDTQQRAKTTYQPVQSIKVVMQNIHANPVAVNVNAIPAVSVPAAAPVVPAPLATARDQWNSLFATQPSLFPKR